MFDLKYVEQTAAFVVGQLSHAGFSDTSVESSQPQQEPLFWALCTHDRAEESVSAEATRVYNIWANREFSGLDTEDIIAETNTRWWNIVKYDKENPFILRNAHAVDVLGTKCRQYMQALKVGISGRHGPVPPQAIYDVMCTDFCTVNDLEREMAMLVSCKTRNATTQANPSVPTCEGDGAGPKEKSLDAVSAHILC